MTQPKTVSIGTVDDSILGFIGYQATMRGSSFAGMCRFILVDYVQNHPDYLTSTPHQKAISPTPNLVEEIETSEPEPSTNSDDDDDLDYNPF